MPAQLIELKVQDGAIKLLRAGRGPSVLFLHGAGGVPQWLPFFDVLAERYELLVPEHPGFGTLRADPARASHGLTGGAGSHCKRSKTAIASPSRCWE